MTWIVKGADVILSVQRIERNEVAKLRRNSAIESIIADIPKKSTTHEGEYGAQRLTANSLELGMIKDCHTSFAAE